MVDVVGALTRKKQQLLRQERSIREDADRRLAEVQAELKTVNNALQTINEALANVLCSYCNGTGSIRRADAAGQMEDWPCPRCKGTGVQFNTEGAE